MHSLQFTMTSINSSQCTVSAVLLNGFQRRDVPFSLCSRTVNLALATTALLTYSYQLKSDYSLCSLHWPYRKHRSQSYSIIALVFTQFAECTSVHSAKLNGIIKDSCKRECCDECLTAVSNGCCLEPDILVYVTISWYTLRELPCWFWVVSCFILFFFYCYLIELKVGFYPVAVVLQ
jgi:hypothetical protein